MRMEGTAAELPALLGMASDLAAARDAIEDLETLTSVPPTAAGSASVAEAVAAVAEDWRLRRALLAQQLGVLACYVEASARSFAHADEAVITVVRR